MSIAEENVKPISLNLLLQQNIFGYSIFIKVAGKYINYSSEVCRDDLDKLKMKKVETVFILNEEYAKFISNQVVIQEKEESREDQVSRDVIKSYIEDHALLKSLFTEVGFPEKKIELIHRLTKKSQEIIEKTDSLAALFQTFNATHATSLIKKQMEIYLTSEMIPYALSKDEIVKTDHFVTQMSRAILVCDLLLTEDEYWDSYRKDPSKLSPKIRSHSFEILKHIPVTDFLSPPFVSFIKQHHEKADGKGYPSAINYLNLNPFTCVYLIAEEFVSKFLAKKMKLNMVPEIIDEVNLQYKKFLVGPNMDNALKAFNIVMKNEKHYFAEGDNE